MTHALARQAEFAARGERVEPYDGGVEGRNAAIEAGSTRTPAEHVAALSTARDRAVAAWPGQGSALWDAPTAYRDGPVRGCVLAWWRETRIHLVDVDAGIGTDSWDARLLEHLADFLASRLPAGVALSDDLWSGDGAPDAARAPGASPSGTGTVVTGAPADVIAWLAGREPGGTVRAAQGDRQVPLPDLAPWPSAVAPAAR